MRQDITQDKIMINIFENNKTMVIDGLTYNQMVVLQCFIHRNVFDKFHSLHYYNSELKEVYQIVVEGSARYRNMLRVLADNPQCLEDTIKPDKFVAEMSKFTSQNQPFPPTKRKVLACPTPWDN